MEVQSVWSPWIQQGAATGVGAKATLLRKRGEKEDILLLKGALFNLIFETKGHFSQKKGTFFLQINMYLKKIEKWSGRNPRGVRFLFLGQAPPLFSLLPSLNPAITTFFGIQLDFVDVFKTCSSGVSIRQKSPLPGPITAHLRFRQPINTHKMVKFK